MQNQTLASQWLASLQKSGCRITSARNIIVEELTCAQRALEPADLYALCRKKDPHLGLVTVYRTLEQLESLGLIQRVHRSDGCHMIMRKNDGHEHLLICTSCGKTVSFQGDHLELLFDRVALETGFSVEDHMLQLFGLCPECRADVHE